MTTAAFTIGVVILLFGLAVGYTIGRQVTHRMYERLMK